MTGISNRPPKLKNNSEEEALSLVKDTRDSAAMLSNSSNAVDLVSQEAEKFDKMYAKRAFVHWYVSHDMEEGEFAEAGNSMRVLIMDH